ncbi:MAG: hypothetical protein IJB74_03715 [Clostridia bacterium]|nr:hypothetical protein [Clostridia bacterium]
MKKFLAVLLSLVMVFSMSAVSFAAFDADIDDAKTAVENVSGDAKDVIGSGADVVESLKDKDYASAVKGAFVFIEKLFNAIHSLVCTLADLFNFDCPFCDGAVTDAPETEEPTTEEPTTEEPTTEEPTTEEPTTEEPTTEEPTTEEPTTEEPTTEEPTTEEPTTEEPTTEEPTTEEPTTEEPTTEEPTTEEPTTEEPTTEEPTTEEPTTEATTVGGFVIDASYSGEVVLTSDKKIVDDTAVLANKSVSQLILEGITAEVNNVVVLNKSNTLFFIGGNYTVPAGGKLVIDKSGDTFTQVFIAKNVPLTINGEVITTKDQAKAYMSNVEYIQFFNY